MLRLDGQGQGSYYGPPLAVWRAADTVGVVAKKSRNRGRAGPPRTSAASAGRSAPVRAGTAQLTAPPPAGANTGANAYPGKQFGLPERGPMSAAGMPRRLAALFIDWLLCMVIAYGLLRSPLWTIVVFAVEVFMLTALTGFTVGKRLVGIRVMRTNGGPVGFRWALLRTAILLTVVPPLLTDRDLRGLHDRAADTIVVRL
jgi:uncharacterized RDD family membrane protein YckC